MKESRLCWIVHGANMGKTAGREKHNTTDKNYPPLNEPCKKSCLDLKSGEEVSVNKGHHLTGKCHGKSDFPYSLNPRIKTNHHKDIMERIRNAMKPERQQMYRLFGSWEGDPKVDSTKCPDKTWRKTDIKYGLKNKSGKTGKDDLIIIYKRHKKRNHAEKVGESNRNLRRGLNIRWKKSVSEPRVTGDKHAKESFQEMEPRLSIPSHINYFARKGDSQRKETEKLKSHSKKKGPYRSKSNTDSRTKSGRRLELMADRKLNLHKEMIMSLKTLRKNKFEPTHQGNKYSLSSFYVKKIFEGSDYSKQNLLATLNYQNVKKPVSWSSTHCKKIDMSPAGYSEIEPKNHSLFITKKRQEVKAVHRLNYEVANPFSSKSMTPMESYWKNTILESSAQNETEVDKLSFIEMSLLNSTVSSQTEELIYKLPKHMKQYEELIKKINKVKKANHKDIQFIKGSKSDSKVIGRTKSEKTDSERGFKHAADSVFMYPFWYKLFKKKKSKKAVQKKSSSHKEKKSKRKSDSDSTERRTGCSTSTNCRKHRKERCRHKKHRQKVEKGFCCEACKQLQKRVICLEKALEQVRSKISYYDFQNTVLRTCEAPEISMTCPKEVRQCQCTNYYHHLEHDSKCQQQQQHHHLCHNQQQQQQQQQQQYQQTENKVSCFPVKTCSLETIVHHSKNRDLVLKSSTSDCLLNVGMEIKMENVDPSTGKKLKGEVRRNFQQDGNIQCRMFEEGQAPLLVLDTDFQYNPLTGMLFKNQKSPSTKTHSTSVVLPLKTIKECKMLPVDCDKKFSKAQNAYQAFGCTQKLTKKNLENKPKGRKSFSLEQNSLNKIGAQEGSAVKSKRSQSLESSSGTKETMQECAEKGFQTDLRLEEKESSTRAKLKEKFLENELPQLSGSSSARIKTCRRPKSGKSFIPTRKKPTPSVVGRSTSGTSSLLSLANSNKSSMHESYSNGSSKQSLAKLFSFTWTFGFFLCKWVHYMQSVSAICSVLTLTAMSLERYYAIVHPMKAQYICTISQARRIITGTWVSAFLLAVPILFAQVHLRVGVKVEAYWCVRDWDNKIVWRAHELYMFLLILIVPTAVMAVAYTAICWEIWEVMQRRQDMTSGKEKGFCKKPVRNSSTESLPSFIYSNNQSRLGNKRKGRAFLKKELADDASSVKQVIKMLVAVLVIYVLCWGPMLIDNVLQAYGILSHIRIGWMKYMGTAFHLMAYFNSCINPIIYGFMSKNFRDSFRKTLCCMGRKQKMALRSFSLSQTRNTSIRYAESRQDKQLPYLRSDLPNRLLSVLPPGKTAECIHLGSIQVSVEPCRSLYPFDDEEKYS